MSKLTRQGFLTKTSLGALAVGALSLVPSVAIAAGRPQASRRAARDAMAGKAAPFVVYVRNPAAGELVVMAGEEEVTVHDPALVEHLWHARHAMSHRSARSVVR